MAARLFGGKQKDVPRRGSVERLSRRPSFSYYSAENTNKGGQGARLRPQVEERGLRLPSLRSLPTVLALGAILISIVYSTTLSSAPKILFADGTSPYRSTAEYQTEIQKKLRASLLNQSKLTIDTAKIEKEILAHFPELDAARLVLPIIGRRPALTLHVRQPILLMTTKTNALVVDATGKVVSTSQQLLSSEVDALLPVQDESSLELKVGDQAVTTETVAFIHNIGQQLADKKLDIDRLILPAIANELDVYIKGQAYFVKMDVSGDPRAQAGTFLAARNNLLENDSSPAEYMDVRVEEKVFYK